MSTVPLMTFPGDVESENSIADDFCYKNNVAQAHIYIRMGFLRKVYGLLSVQLACTCILAAVGLFTPEARLFVHNNDWLMSLAFILSIVLIIALHVKRRETPINFFLLAAFTIVQAYTVAVLATYYDQLTVLQAFVLTLAVTAGLTAYTFQTKRDFTALGASLIAVLLILIVAGILQVFIQSTAVELLISLVGSVVFSLFIIIDTQMLLKHTSPEEYILATINLYLDILNLFIYLLRALDAVRHH